MLIEVCKMMTPPKKSDNEIIADTVVEKLIAKGVFK